jgi:hypothetical protein
VLKITSLVDSLGSVLHGRIEDQYRADLVRSIQAFSTSPSSTDAQIPTRTALFAFRSNEEQFYEVMHTEIALVLAPALPAERLLAEAGLWPCVTPQTLLSLLSLRRRVHTPEKWIKAVSVYANQIIAVQRSRRLLHYGTRGLVTEFNREMLHGRQRQTLGHPDSLLVEIDADICIRSDQMSIAEAMIDPNGGKNTVMQLNMGEGKSSASLHPDHVRSVTHISAGHCSHCCGSTRKHGSACSRYCPQASVEAAAQPTSRATFEVGQPQNHMPSIQS